MKLRFEFGLLKKLLLLVIVLGVPSQPQRLIGQEIGAGRGGGGNLGGGDADPGGRSTQQSSTQQSSTTRTLDDIRKAAKSKSKNSAGMSGGMGMGVGDIGGRGGGMPGGGMGGGEGSGMGGGMPGGMGMGAAPPSEKELLVQLIQKLRARLSSKKHDRLAVEKQLRAALQQYFDADMEERVTEFDKVKARLTEMESKLQRRLNSDTEIVELQLKQMLHKADGLDFNIPNSDGNADFGSMGMGSGMGGLAGGMPGGMAGLGEGGPGGMAGLGGGAGMPGMGSGGAPGELGGGRGSMAGGEGGYGSIGGYGGYGGSGLGEGGGDPSMSTMGYDASFGLTRVQRLDGEPLEAQDPLESYKKSPATTVLDPSTLSNQDKLSQILIAFHQFNSQFNHLPRSANRHTKNQPPHSWRVAILPLIGQAELYRAYKFDQPWDSPENMRLAAKMPELYRTSKSSSKNTTAFQILVGDGAYDSSSTPPTMFEITDGTSNTLAIIESSTEVVWTKPEDVQYSADKKTLPLAESRLVGFVDGVVRKLPNRLESSQLHALVTRAGGEVFTLAE